MTTKIYGLYVYEEWDNDNDFEYEPDYVTLDKSLLENYLKNKGCTFELGSSCWKKKQDNGNTYVFIQEKKLVEKIEQLEDNL